MYNFLNIINKKFVPDIYYELLKYQVFELLKMKITT